MIPFFLKREGFTKRPPSFYSPHQMTPYFSFVLTERPPFSLFSLSPKDSYFGGLVPTSPSLPYVSAFPPPRASIHSNICCHGDVSLYNWRYLREAPKILRFLVVPPKATWKKISLPRSLPTLSSTHDKQPTNHTRSSSFSQSLRKLREFRYWGKNEQKTKTKQNKNKQKQNKSKSKNKDHFGDFSKENSV